MHRRQRSHSVNKTVNSCSAVPSKNKHTEFEKVKSYLNTLTEKLIFIEKISNRINKERQDLVSEMNYFYPIFNMWASNEPQLASFLQNIGSATEKDASAQTTLISSYVNVLGNPIKDFLSYIEVVQETVNKRDVYQNVYDVSMEELYKRRNEKDKVYFIKYFFAIGVLNILIKASKMSGFMIIIARNI